MKKEEQEQQIAFFDWLRAYENRFYVLKYFFHCPNGGNRNIITASVMKKMGVKRGVLDVFCPIKNEQFSGLWIEMKSDKGKISPEQAEWIQVLRVNNYSVRVCREWREAAAVVIEYFELPIKI